MTTERILEVWHGGIPSDGSAPQLPRCTDPACTERGGHSHTERISDAPFGIPWGLWVTHHMERQPDRIVHVDSPRECGFCHGRPVSDAASWIDGKPRPPAPCPRCGVTHSGPTS